MESRPPRAVRNHHLPLYGLPKPSFAAGPRPIGIPSTATSSVLASAVHTGPSIFPQKNAVVEGNAPIRRHRKQKKAREEKEEKDMENY